ncbi:MAG TPA: HEAT repeat domain-containing protein [Polyangia bacterium]|jgi:hypothetical protein
MGSTRRAFLALLCVLLAEAGCAPRRAQPPGRPLLVELHIVDRTPAGDRPATADLVAIRAEALRLQREAGVFTPALGQVPAPGQEAWRLRLEVGLGEGHRDGKGLARAAVVIRMDQIGGPADAPRLDTQGGAEQPYARESPDVNGVYTSLVTRTMGDLMKGLLTRARLRHADLPSLISALGHDEPEVRLGAVAAAAERRDRGSVPALLERLADPVDIIRDRALGALVEIGDPRAVKALTKQTKFQDLEGMHKIIDAVASLGGDEARSYLEFVVSGHEDPEVRDQAREALERLRRKEQMARGK